MGSGWISLYVSRNPASFRSVEQGHRTDTPLWSAVPAVAIVQSSADGSLKSPQMITSLPLEISFAASSITLLSTGILEEALFCLKISSSEVTGAPSFFQLTPSYPLGR